MTRPDLAKLGYLTALVVLSYAAFLLAEDLVRAGSIGLLLALGVLLLLPSRLQALLLRRHFRGRRAHLARRLDDALGLYREQLTELQARPWKNHAVWLGWMFYTTRADAMVWNNIAAVQLDRRQLGAARDAAGEALKLDPKYPLPWVNLAGAALLSEDRPEAERCLAEARKLGYRGTNIDQLIHATSAAWAKVQAAPDRSDKA